MGQPDSTACDFTEALGSRFSLLFYIQTRKHIGSRTYKQFCNYDGWAWWKWNKNEGSRAEKLIKLPEHLDQVLPGFLHLHHTINFLWCLSQFTLHFLLFTTENTLTDKASRSKVFILTEIWKGCRRKVQDIQRWQLSPTNEKICLWIHSVYWIRRGKVLLNLYRRTQVPKILRNIYLNFFLNLKLQGLRKNQAET